MRVHCITKMTVIKGRIIKEDRMTTHHGPYRYRKSIGLDWRRFVEVGCLYHQIHLHKETIKFGNFSNYFSYEFGFKASNNLRKIEFSNLCNAFPLIFSNNNLVVSLFHQLFRAKLGICATAKKDFSKK